MAVAFVNSAEAQSQPAVTSLDTTAYALTAGNFSHVFLRVGSNIALSDISAVTDTAGNTYVPGGAVSTSAGRLFYFFAANCLGNGSNVVHAAFTSSAFCHLVASQWSGMPLSVGADVVALSQGAGGTTITINPSSNSLEQLVIIAADLANSGHSSISGGSFTLLASGTYGPGVGSDDAWSNINTTRDFDGSVAVTCTFSGAFSASAKSMLSAVYRLQATAPVPVSTPNAARTPCEPQAVVTNGGKGAAGCNVGTRWPLPWTFFDVGNHSLGRL